jgi:uncharacterized RDD family membrane protein YckC
MNDEQGQLPTTLGRYAGFVTRMVAFFIDRAIVGLCAAVAVIAIDYILNAFEINQLLGFFEITWQGMAILSGGIYLLLSIAYDVAFWMLAGQTPGKRVMGLRIVRSDGDRVRAGNAVRREVGYVISGILFLGYLWILFDNRRQGWHDKLAGTIVVYSWPEEEVQGTMVRDRLQRIAERRRAGQSETAAMESRPTT